jgi:DNA primase
MSGRIPQAFINDLMTRTDIVDVIDARVPLKKAGREYKACCPFHNEKTPSFTVSQTKQFYHCFGCGAHGTAISFLMDYDHMEFVEAIEELAHRAGVDVPREAAPGPSPPPTQRLYALLADVAHFYRQQLRNHPQATRAIDYLKQRGLTGEIATHFEIGFAPPGWDNLAKALARDAASRAALLETGLLIERDGGGVYDRFRDRIQFPIRDRRGRTVGFGGRVLGEDTPKYLNSPESAVFHKGRELYGFYEVRKAVRHLERILVVEGYMDVVALAQFGISYTVATLGTATTPDHLERLYRTVPEVVFCFDGDRAGRAAAWRALENTLSVLTDGREARFLFLPEGEDPDTVVRKIGKDEFELRIKNAVHLSDFLFDHLSGQVDTASIDGRARLVDVARPLLARLPDSIFRQLLLERLAQIVRTDSRRLAERLDKPPENRLAAATSTTRVAHPDGRGNSPVRAAIAILLNRPELAVNIAPPRIPEPGAVAGVSLLLELLELLQRQPGLNTAAILEHWRGREEARHLHKLAQWSPLSERLDLGAELRGHLARIVRQATDKRIATLLGEEQHRALNNSEKQELKSLLQSRQEDLGG